MNAEKSSSLLDWLLAIIFNVILIAMLIWTPQWFWLSLPFALTFLVRAIRVM